MEPIVTAVACLHRIRLYVRLKIEANRKHSGMSDVASDIWLSKDTEFVSEAPFAVKK